MIWKSGGGSLIRTVFVVGDANRRTVRIGTQEMSLLGMQKIVDIIEGHQFFRSDEVGCYLCGEVRKSRKIPVSFGMTAMVAQCPACRIAFQTPVPSPEASLSYMNWRWRSSDAYVADRPHQLRRALRHMNFVEQACVTS